MNLDKEKYNELARLIKPNGDKCTHHELYERLEIQSNALNWLEKEGTPEIWSLFRAFVRNLDEK
jgi:hypothetical protein